MKNLLKPALLSSQEWHALTTFYEAIGTHRLDLLNNVLTTDWLDLPPSPGQKPGSEGVKPILQGLIDAFPDLVAKVNLWHTSRTTDGTACIRQVHDIVVA
jgi:hypothetical protein